jgi:hypothetical protein
MNTNTKKVLKRILDKHFSGHINIGNVTIYGRNAMHWGVNIWTKRWGYVCFRLPLRCFGQWWPLYFYVSPNATPWAATFYLAQVRDWRARAAVAKQRRDAFGHNFNTDIHWDALRAMDNE